MTTTTLQASTGVNIPFGNRVRVGHRFVLGVRYDNIDCRSALTLIEQFIHNRSRGPARSVFFTNVHSIHEAQRDRDLQNIINLADLVLPDGSGLSLASRMMRSPLQENLNGTDFVPKLLARAATEGWSVYLLGATWKSVFACAERLRRQYPTLDIAGCHQGYIKEAEKEQVLQEVNRRSPDILLVAMGTPHQEFWISENLARVQARVCLGVGGLFDFLSGERSRAPGWMRRVGVEWIYRFVQDPSTKWKRVLIEIPVFLMRIAVSTLLRFGERHAAYTTLWIHG